ncbi:MAG TPA: serine hydrolase [Thiobacillaceae bacterium]|nr:serine hydrolase [Thiobacillaceae bacterium]
MKKTLLLLTLSTFLAAPLANAVEGSPDSSPKAKSHKTAAHKAKPRKTAGRSKTVKPASQARLATKSSKRVREAYNAHTPLRVIKVNYDDALKANELALKSAAALVVDQKSGEALYAKNVDVATPIASITKLMTAMVTLDAGLPLNEEIVIGNEDMDRLKGTGSRLALGTRLTRGELLHLALIASENRAAAALSRAYPGGREAFVAAMNEKARTIGMHQARFVDGTGLDSRNQATAADLVKMVDTAYRYPLIREITRTGTYDVTLPAHRIVRIKENGHIRRVNQEVLRQTAFNNTNALTRDQNWDIGVSKTGYINEAGRCLVMQASIAERKVIIVLLDSWGKFSRIGDAQRIKKWIEKDNHVASRGHRDSA